MIPGLINKHWREEWTDLMISDGNQNKFSKVISKKWRNYFCFVQIMLLIYLSVCVAFRWPLKVNNTHSGSTVLTSLKKLDKLLSSKWIFTKISGQKYTVAIRILVKSGFQIVEFVRQSKGAVSKGIWIPDHFSVLGVKNVIRIPDFLIQFSGHEMENGHLKTKC